MESVTLWFQPGDRREDFRWAATYRDRMVGLCNHPLCEICKVAEREKLRGFRGGELEVQLTLHRRPSFWETREFYLGHLVSVLERRAVSIDEGIEYDISRFNALLCTVDRGAVLIDPGSMGFNGDETPLQQLIANQRLVATLVTHGHLDHWNLVKATRGPVYMSSLTHRLISRHASIQRDAELGRVLRRAQRMIPGEPILLEGNLPIEIETFPLSHSIPETMGLVIKGRKKRIVHLGDFKFCGFQTKAKAELISILSEISKEKVDLLFLNIINAHIQGYTPIEESVIENLTNILVRAKGRVIIACFSTNLERIQRIIEIAQLLRRPVEFCGTGMKSSQETLGLKTEEGEDFSKEVVFVTGCQAEENSVLWRIVERENPPLELRPAEDTLVFSSRCIPGNEESLNRLITNIRSQVERVIVNEGGIEQVGLKDLGIEEALVHVSGHEYAEGLGLALKILQPKKVLPYPQTSPQIEAFREIAESLGVEILDEKERKIEV